MSINLSGYHTKTTTLGIAKQQLTEQLLSTNARFFLIICCFFSSFPNCRLASYVPSPPFSMPMVLARLLQLQQRHWPDESFYEYDSGATSLPTLADGRAIAYSCARIWFRARPDECGRTYVHTCVREWCTLGSIAACKKTSSSISLRSSSSGSSIRIYYLSAIA